MQTLPISRPEEPIDKLGPHLRIDFWLSNNCFQSYSVIRCSLRPQQAGENVLQVHFSSPLSVLNFDVCFSLLGSDTVQEIVPLSSHGERDGWHQMLPSYITVLVLHYLVSLNLGVLIRDTMQHIALSGRGQISHRVGKEVLLLLSVITLRRYHLLNACTLQQVGGTFRL